MYFLDSVVIVFNADGTNIDGILYVKYDFNGTLEGMNGSVGEFKGAATLLEENEKIVVDSFKILN